MKKVVCYHCETTQETRKTSIPHFNSSSCSSFVLSSSLALMIQLLPAVVVLVMMNVLTKRCEIRETSINTENTHLSLFILANESKYKNLCE